MKKTGFENGITKEYIESDAKKNVFNDSICKSKTKHALLY